MCVNLNMRLGVPPAWTQMSPPRGFRTDTEEPVFNPPLFDPHVLHSIILQNHCVCLLKARLPSKKYNNMPIWATDYSGCWPANTLRFVCIPACNVLICLTPLIFLVAQHEGPDCVVVARVVASQPLFEFPDVDSLTVGILV